MAKATRKQALGGGLSALLKDPENDINSVSDRNADKVVGNIVELDIDTIEVKPFQPRSHFNDDNLQELASSINELGVIQPITVRKSDFNKFQLVSGERRYLLFLWENLHRRRYKPISRRFFLGCF